MVLMVRIKLAVTVIGNNIGDGSGWDSYGCDDNGVKEMMMVLIMAIIMGFTHFSRTIGEMTHMACLHYRK